MLETNVSIPAFLKAALDAESQRLEPAFRRSSRPLGAVPSDTRIAQDYRTNVRTDRRLNPMFSPLHGPTSGFAFMSPKAGQ
jgi:hypothetical protein